MIDIPESTKLMVSREVYVIGQRKVGFFSVASLPCLCVPGELEMVRAFSHIGVCVCVCNKLCALGKKNNPTTDELHSVSNW